MGHIKIISRAGNFKLASYLEADLRRAKALANKPHDQLSAFKIWIGIFSPRFIPVLLCRLAFYFYLLKLRPIAKLFSLINFSFFGIEIAIECHIGKGIFFPHTQGTVIGAYSIGENVTIFQGVTLGAKELDFSFKEKSRPKIGGNVIVGSGAKVLGGISVGSGSQIGANSVVLASLPPNVLAVGIPAHIVKILV
jgi:serine O-acetyltransferase